MLQKRCKFKTNFSSASNFLNNFFIIFFRAHSGKAKSNRHFTFNLLIISMINSTNGSNTLFVKYCYTGFEALNLLIFARHPGYCKRRKTLKEKRETRHHHLYRKRLMLRFGVFSNSQG